MSKQTKIPSARELLENHGVELKMPTVWTDTVPDFMIEYAKLHCKILAEVIAEKAKTTKSSDIIGEWTPVDKQSIFNVAKTYEEEIR